MKVRWLVVVLFCSALLACTVAASPRPVASAASPSAALPQDDHDWQHHDWEHDKRFEGRSAAYRQGYRDGYTDGHRDRDNRRVFRYGLGYKHPDRGYRPEFGDRHVYMNEYRDAYAKGYEEGYGPRR